MASPFAHVAKLFWEFPTVFSSDVYRVYVDRESWRPFDAEAFVHLSFLTLDMFPLRSSNARADVHKIASM